MGAWGEAVWCWEDKELGALATSRKEWKLIWMRLGPWGEETSSVAIPEPFALWNLRGWVYLHGCLCMHGSRYIIWLCCFSSLFYYGEENILFMHCITSTVICIGVKYELFKMQCNLFLTKHDVPRFFSSLISKLPFPPLCDFKLCPWFNSVKEVE